MSPAGAPAQGAGTIGIGGDLTDRSSESMLDLCEQEEIAFLPYSPVQDFDGNAVVAATASAI